MSDPLEFNSKGVDGDGDGEEEKRGRKRDADGAVK